MSMRAAVNAIDDIRGIWLSPRGLRVLNYDGKPRFFQVNTGHSHWAEYRVPVTQEPSEPSIATEGGKELLGCAVDGIARMEH